MAASYVACLFLICACVQQGLPWVLKQKHRSSEDENTSALESDMLLSRTQLEALLTGGSNSTNQRFKRKAVAHDSNLWPRGVLVFEFDPGLPETYRQYFRTATRMWSEGTCIRFREYRGPSTFSGLGHSGRVLVSSGPYCESVIGFNGNGQQTMHLGGSCMDPDDKPVGHAAHELGHALGLFHEQSRPDRDEHIAIHWQNVKAGAEVNFHKYRNSQMETVEPYDLGSVMHYGPLYMSKDPDGFQFTMDARAEGKRPVMGQRSGLSFLDLKTMNDLYQCSASCPKLLCKNGGDVEPGCKKCNCPLGFAGSTCDDVTKSSGDCGGKLTSSSGSIASPGDSSGYYDNLDCHWIIEGPPGSSISLQFQLFDLEDDALCAWDWLEVRDDGPTMAGSRFCGLKHDHVIEYDGNVLYLRMRTDDSNGGEGFRATYTISQEGGWLPWNEWSSCTKACGGGTRMRTRSCPSNRCHGGFTQSSPCNGHACSSV